MFLKKNFNQLFQRQKFFVQKTLAKTASPTSMVSLSFFFFSFLFLLLKMFFLKREHYITWTAHRVIAKLRSQYQSFINMILIGRFIFFNLRSSIQNVVPMLYPKNQKPLQLNSSKCFRMLKVGATGFEPVTLCL